MFKEKVNTWTDGRTDDRTHDGQQTMTSACWPMASGANKGLSGKGLSLYYTIQLF